MTKIKSTKRPLPCCISFCTEGEGEERAWKGFDWETMNRLYEKGYIQRPPIKGKIGYDDDRGCETRCRIVCRKIRLHERSSAHASLMTNRFPQAEAYFRSVDRLGECFRSPSDDSIRASEDGLMPMRFAISAWVSPAFVLAVNSASSAANSSSSAS